MFSANGDGCVAPGEPGCMRKAIFDGEQRCTADEVCPPNTWVDADDEFLCVEDCTRWTKDAATSELKCVDECPGWWYVSENGLCKEEVWRKNTAITVPVVAAVVIAAVIMAVILVKRRAKGAHEAKPAGVMRDNVVNS